MPKPDPLRQILADNVHAYRVRAKLSQDEFAHKCGIHRTYVGSVERSERNVTLSTLDMLAKAMESDVPTILTKGGIK